MGTNLNFKWTITSLTPLHIGNGKVMRQGFDFVAYQNRLWIANQGAIFAAMLPRAGPDPIQAAKHLASITLEQMLANDWLQAEHFDLEKSFFYYALHGQTSTTNQQGLLHAFIKDVYHRPYLPGSSLKGAIRSALLKAHVDLDALDINFNNGRYAARNIENAIFVPNPKQRSGKAPNFSLWRAIKIMDGTPVPTQKLALANVITFPMPQKDSPESTHLELDFEALPAGVPFETLFQVEKGLFERPITGNANRDLAFTPKHLAWFVQDLCASVNKQSLNRLGEDIRFYEHLEKTQASKLSLDTRTTAETLRQLQTACRAASPEEMILPLGRGTGWLSKISSDWLKTMNLVVDPGNKTTIFPTHACCPPAVNRSESPWDG
jgi:CRISPR-associated protein Csm5